MNATTKQAECRIVIVNDVLGTRVETMSPQTVKEALQDHGDVRIAKEWADWFGVAPDSFGNEPIAVCLHQTDDQIIVRWHVVGDPEAARVAMQTVLDGSWRAME